MIAERTKPPDLDAIRARADKATQFAEQMRDYGEATFVTRAPVLTASLMRGGSYTLAEAVEDQAALLAEIERLREALAHAQATIGLATSYIPAARFEEFVNRRAALAAQESTK